MSFGRWRQQLHIILVLQWLSQGASVQSVATDLGYESAAALWSCSARPWALPPARYMTQRAGGLTKCCFAELTVRLPL